MLTVKQILGINAGLLALEKIEQPLPAGLDFKLSRVFTKINPIVEDFNKKREKLVKELGIPANIDGKEGLFSFTKENGEIFNERLVEIHNIEEEVDIIPLNLSSFNKINVPFGFFTDLDPIIKDDTV